MGLFSGDKTYQLTEQYSNPSTSGAQSESGDANSSVVSTANSVNTSVTVNNVGTDYGAIANALTLVDRVDTRRDNEVKSFLSALNIIDSRRSLEAYNTLSFLNTVDARRGVESENLLNLSGALVTEVLKSTDKTAAEVLGLIDVTQKNANQLIVDNQGFTKNLVTEITGFVAEQGRAADSRLSQALDFVNTQNSADGGALNRAFWLAAAAVGVIGVVAWRAAA